MSIYSTWLGLDAEDHEGSRWVKQAGPPDHSRSRTCFYYDGTWAVYDPKVRCDCKLPGPIIYQGSHVNPSMDDKRGGVILACAIPDHCHPSTRGSGEGGELVDFLRLSVYEDRRGPSPSGPGAACVVLDRAHVEALRDTLVTWLDAEERF